MNSLSANIKLKAADLGFSRCGIAMAQPMNQEQVQFESSLRLGFHATMSFLERNVTQRFNPADLLPGCKSVVVVLFHYPIDVEWHADYKVARYAFLQDYHVFVKEKLDKLGQWLVEQCPQAHFRTTVDSSAISEKNWAVRAGLGYIGKNSLLQNDLGSFFFIGTMLTDVELDYDKPFVGSCGDCDLCVRACPSGAIELPYRVNAAKCISFRTVEDKSRLMDSPSFHHWIWGCDICQNVCPKNKKIEYNMLATQYSSLFLHFQNSDFENLSEADFQRISNGHGLARRKYSGFKFNIDKVKNEN